jgi:hypothetical protein
MLPFSSKSFVFLSLLEVKEILLFILCGCENWFITLSKEHGLRVSEKRVVRRIFGPKKEEVAGGWRRLHNEELHNLYTSPNLTGVMKSRRIKWEWWDM